MIDQIDDKQIRQIDRQTDRYWNLIHPLKKKEILPFALIWINLGIMPSEISQAEKDTI